MQSEWEQAPLNLDYHHGGRKVLYVGICGPAHVGKSTLAEYLGSNYRCAEVMFARALKEVLSIMTPFTVNELSHGEWREAVIPEFGISMRKAMQETGTFFRKLFGNDIFVKKAMRDAAEKAYNRDYVLFTDVREPIEQQAIIDAGGIILILKRDLAGLSGEAAAHSSETSYMKLLNANPELINDKIFIVDNNGTINDLVARCDAIFKQKMTN